jgi:putative nucleotidyltransferase with HDIG domain
MPKSLKLYIIGVVTASAIALAVTTFVFPPSDQIALVPLGHEGAPSTLQVLMGIGFWTLLTLVSSALPVQMPRGTQQAVAIAPVLASVFLGGPAVGGWVAAIGTTEYRELRGRIPWYGSLANHAGVVLPTITAGVAYEAIRGLSTSIEVQFVAAMAASLILYVFNQFLAAVLISLRTSESVRTVFVGDSRDTATTNLALAPLAWLMSGVYQTTWWATLLFALPLYTTRLGYQKFMEMRLMFTQTIGALAAAVDARDPFTAKHSQNVKSISVEIGRAMRLGDADLEALEWGGLLHDVGKIGVRDDVLLKSERLNRDERMKMNSHPVIGAEIIAQVQKLAPELPIIRHHHEWYNGSGYPDRLMGDEIPLLARILHVADAFEAMTAARPYRMTPLTAEQALGELRKFAGIQFDPVVVDAFVRTHYADGVPDPGRHTQPRPIPLIGQAASGMSAARAETVGLAARAEATAPTAKQA